MKQATPNSGKLARRRSRAPAGLSRRGVVLIVVVSMLALFLLLGVSFALIASQYRLGARSQAEIERVGDDPRTELEMIFGQVVYDTSARSSILGHSLLRDLYGDDYYVFEEGNGAAAASANGGQTWTISFNVADLEDRHGAMPNNFRVGQFSGRVFTFTKDTNGVPINVSTRILAFDPGSNQLLIEAPEAAGGLGLPSNGFGFLINGAPFNGTGAGYETATGNLNITYNLPNSGYTTPTALAPHFGGYPLDPNTIISNISVGGLDEAYDAPDFQNPFLAMVPQRRTSGGNANPLTAVIPSFHRPELVNYWANVGGANLSTNAELQRAVIFRPTPQDHPNFTGSNLQLNGGSGWLANLASLNPIYWDVDNDSDGQPDSVWIDPGLPVVTAPDGRRYKRLAAILIKDLDGRINLNAHGNLAQITATTPPQLGVAVGLGSGTPNNYRADTALPGAFGLAPAGIFLPRGIGYGPAEVDFHDLFNDDNAYAAVLAQRYGFIPSTDAQPGLPGGRDPLSIVHQQGVPNDYSSAGFAFASPPDVWGRGAITLDYGGKPTAAFMGLSGEMSNNPYEHDPYAGDTAVDSPYQPVELEALLRYHDRDITKLGSRNRLLNGDAQSLFAGSAPGTYGLDHALREKFTTISSHISAPVTPVPAFIRASGTLSSIATPGEATILDVYRAKLRQRGVSATADQDIALAQIAPFEFFQGRPFNVNRWLGNGVDDNGNSVIDEAQEVGGNAWSTGGEPAAFSGQTAYASNGFDVNGDGSVNNQDSRLARQFYARHLFCMAMLCVDDTFDHPSTETLGGGQSRRLLTRRIAQWAINCVDFRDPDGIMTHFEFDFDPFTENDATVAGTWEVDGWVAVTPGSDGQLFTQDDGTSSDDGASYRGLVWGVEFPDLLITETFAMHDRRVKDTKHDPSTKEREAPQPNDRDPHPDQFRVPQGSAFVELFCPGRISSVEGPSNTQPYRKYPQELYSGVNLRLGAMVPDASTGQNRPVWRLGFSSINEPGVQQKMPFNLAGIRPDTTTFEPNPLNVFSGQSLNLERYVWFASAADGAGWLETDIAEGGRTFYSQRSVNVTAGGYVVVGPRTATHFGSQDPMQAGVTGLWGGNSQQRIVESGAGTGFVIYDSTGAALPTANTNPHVSVIADMRLPDDGSWTQKPWRVGFNLTEPLPQGMNYYPEPLYTTTPPDAYDDPDAPMNTFKDEPVDNSRLLGPGNANMLNSQTYVDKPAAVYLQRLADPTQRFHNVANPYITVDFSEIEATVFNGEDNNNRMVNGGQWLDPDDPDPLSHNVFLRGKERGKRSGGPNANLWPPIIPNWAAADRSPANNPTPADYFRYTFGTGRQSLGWLNAALGTPLAAPYQGEPNQPFPWLCWNNRPFANPMELLLVPSSSQPRLCFEFSPNDTAVAANPYDVTVGNDDKEFRAVFRHLLNFFQSSDQVQNPTNALQLYQLLDLVETPSPFMRTVKWYDPASFNSQKGYAPPFNNMSRFRDPGRVNINTIYDEHIFTSIIGHNSGANITLAQTMFRSRRGDGATNWLDPSSSSWPTIFANPFRPAHAADLTPNVASMRLSKSVQATLLRPHPDTPNRPLFDAPQSGQDYNNTTKNAYFRYQHLQKLGNMFTTRSNCYAVWITVGYFEVEDNPGGADAAHPDGYRLASEIGADSGEIERHRAFYLVDRSIPVGFLPGQKLNSDQCVLLKRLIE